ncbi:LOW QUALITY PROTEIN: hypothetical protein HID58_026739 [Brassica napus]|uniref:DEAD/DEAH-box helicase domain-containing protein n=1 Tax=Brassica napus TaxID=3708 RepID=A0ABQ8CPT7_BRANA|nr:LOW QUALITY PROTEIN: hypothetical protein HID58_026739 [Brassica napus]
MNVADSEKAASRAKPAYVPTHLRNMQSEPVATLPQNDRPGYGGQPSRWAPGGGVGGGGGYRNDGGRVSGGGGWNNRGGGWDREVNPFGDDADLEPAVQENTGINFDAYEDIPIETRSVKTAAFCFPIISGIMRDQHLQRPRGSRTVYPLAIILSPTRELASQIHEAKTFTCQTGVKVIVAYGGTPINQQLIAAYGLLSAVHD